MRFLARLLGLVLVEPVPYFATGSLRSEAFAAVLFRSIFGKEFGIGVEPKQWINATTLVLLATQEWDDADDPEKTHECKQTIRIVLILPGKFQRNC